MDTVLYARRQRGVATVASAGWARRPLIVSLLFLSLILMVSSFDAARAQPLSVVGNVMWRAPFNPTGAIAYAPDVDLVFAGAYGSKIIVVKGSSGVVQDTIWTDTLGLTPNGKPLSVSSDLSCSRDGRVIAVTVRNDDHSKVVVLEYPSKRILLDSLYIDKWQSWRDFRITVSPTGRYVAVPDTGFYTYSWRNGIRLHDLVEGTSCEISNGSIYAGPVDFDDAERYMVYTRIGTIGSDGQVYRNCISIADLSTFPPVVRNLNDYGRGSISADGRYIMVSGAGIGMNPDWSDPITRPRASVYDRATDSLIWRVSGDYRSQPPDFVQHQWSKDAGTFFTRGTSTSAPPDWGSRGVFYRVGDSLPYARPCDTCYFNGQVLTDGYGTVGTPDLRVTFINAFGSGGLVAYSMTPTTSVEDAPIGSSVVYPNPSTGEVRMRCASPQIAIRWGLASVSGQEIARGLLTAQDAQPTDGAYVIRLGTDLPHGTYFLTLYGEQGTALCTQNVGRI
jgi:hypothetical protein